jgi:5-amino-6-(5-phospho-D-ribitylamino)uracil phosphatase
MPGPYKLLVVDLDGTILNREGILSNTDRQALNYVRESGLGISICTGRASSGCLNYPEILSPEGFHIFFDGAMVSNSHLTEEIFIRTLDKDLVRSVCQRVQSHKIPLELFTRKQVFIDESNERIGSHLKILNMKPVNAKIADICEKETLLMGCLITASSEEEQKIKTLSLEYKDTLRFSWTRHPAHPNFLFINFTVPGLSKGKALETLCSHLKIHLDQVIAIGDGSNDVSLLAKAGLAIAMQNSPAELKEIADYITADVDHNGVARAVKKFL